MPFGGSHVSPRWISTIPLPHAGTQPPSSHAPTTLSESETQALPPAGARQRSTLRLTEPRVTPCASVTQQTTPVPALHTERFS